MFVRSLLATALYAVCAAAAGQRVTFSSSGTQIVGYYYAPANPTGPAPAVVIAHGLAGLQTSRLGPYAERFASEGYHAITFDYRYWGQSDGQPRNIIDVSSQQDDYRAAIKYIQSVQGVDPNRIVVWGTSLSGGHALELGAKMPNLAAVIVQAPHVNGPATVSQLPPESIPGLTAVGIADNNPLRANNPIYVPAAARRGELGLLTQAGAVEGYQFIQPNPPPPGNVVPARFVPQLPLFNPDLIAASSTLPTYFGIAKDDNVTPAFASRSLANRMVNADIHEFPGGHFDVYPSKPAYPANIAAQVAFLKKYVPV